MSRILVGVDGSTASDAAVRYAADVAARHGAELHVVHVVTGYSSLVPTAVQGLEEAGQAVLAQALDLAKTLVDPGQIRGELLHGQRQAALLEAAKGADLVVVGFQPHSTLERLVTGSTTTALAAGAHCPVTIVPDGWEGNGRGRVGVGIKTVDTAGPLLRKALGIARKRGARLEIMHTWHLPTTAYDALMLPDQLDTEGWTDDMRAALAEVCDPVCAEYPEVETTTRVLERHPAAALVALGEQVDLLVLARRARLFPRGHLGGTARAMLREAPCPILVVPPPGEDEEPDPLV
ncbi:universal stress protein [Nocardioides sp. DS6]|uniref:Universal stress protein n=1 Tax=Nocardioides eburneus TaxID=3231482 RepID=A0ABV3T2S2_9ACTN